MVRKDLFDLANTLRLKNPIEEIAMLLRGSRRRARQAIAAAAVQPLRLANGSRPGALGAARASRRGQTSQLDGRRLAVPSDLAGAAGGQTAEGPPSGAALKATAPNRVCRSPNCDHHPRNDGSGCVLTSIWHISGASIAVSSISIAGAQAGDGPSTSFSLRRRAVPERRRGRIALRKLCPPYGRNSSRDAAGSGQRLRRRRPPAIRSRPTQFGAAPIAGSREGLKGDSPSLVEF